MIDPDAVKRANSLFPFGGAAGVQSAVAKKDDSQKPAATDTAAGATTAVDSASKPGAAEPTTAKDVGDR